MKTGRILLTAATCVLLSASLCFAGHKEKVKVTHIEHYKIIVKRDNGAKFELRIGNGCPAIWNYKKQDVILKSGSDKFLGYNSRIVLKRENQQCPVTSYARIKGPTRRR